LAALLILPGCTYNVIPRSYSAESIEAWVVDEATGKPLEGVIVVAHWPLEVERHDSWVGELQIMETVTDKNGRFFFPAWGPKYAKRGHLTYLDPAIYLYKDGYRWKALTNNFTTAVSYKESRSSKWNQETVSLQAFMGSTEKYASHLGDLSNFLNFLYKGEYCFWRQAPRILLALHLKRKFFLQNRIYYGPGSIYELGDSCGVVQYYKDELK